MKSLLKVLFLIFNFKQKFIFYFISIMIFVSLLLEAFGIGMLLPIMKILIENKKTTNISVIDNFLSNFTLKETFIFYLLIFFIFFIIKNLIVSATLFLQLKIVYQVKKKLSRILYEKFLFKEYEYYIQTNTSVLINKLGQSINDFTHSLKFVFNTFSDLLFVTILLLILLYLNFFATLVIIFTILIPTQIFVLVRRKKQSISGKEKNLSEQLNIKNIQQSISGIKEIKLLKLEKFFLNIFKLNIENICRHESKQYFFAQLPKVIIEIITVTIFVSSLLLFSVNYFEDIITIIPSLAVFAAVFFRIVPSLSRLLESQQMVYFHKKAIQDIYEEIKKRVRAPASIIPNINKIKIPNFLNIKNVTFAHKNNKNILYKLNYKIKLKGLVAIFGKTGVGKSTLVDIIIGFLKPSSGKITLDNKDINENFKILNTWQSCLGYVPQNINILDETIEKNIAIGQNLDEIDKIKIKKILKICLLEDFVKSKQKEINTILGERGSKISGGQKQKIGIARALYYNPKILILDEATNAMDKNSQTTIINNIESSNFVKCVILITHDRNLLNKCKQRIYLY